jgi:hypothetical protein
MDSLRLAPVTLAELDALASLQTRRDRKYVVPRAELDRVLAELGGKARILEIDGARTFRYRSVYFDTPDLALYLAAAHGLPRRAKVRTRTYVDADACVLEVKVRDGRGRTVKHRFPYSIDNAMRLTEVARRTIASIGAPLAAGARVPTLVTSFERATLLLGANGRATIDVDLGFTSMDDRSARMEQVAVIETKSTHGATRLDRLLRAAGHRPHRFSKYGTGLAVVRPELPSHRWRRALSLTGLEDLRTMTRAGIRKRSPSPLADRLAATGGLTVVGAEPTL